MFRILIVEDEPDIGELLQNYLEHAGYVTRLAQEGQGALTLFYQETFDLVLLDLMLPKMDGYALCQAIREQSDVPVIMVTALDSEEHQLQGFRFNIDDYVTKPFSIPVLLQKIRAVLRRTTGHAGDEPICYRNLTLDLEGYQAYLGGTPVDLTMREIALLRTLLENQGRVLTRQMLLNRVWSYDFYGDERIVDTHIKNLRKKLEADYIETVRGVGYRMERENKT